MKHFLLALLLLAGWPASGEESQGVHGLRRIAMTFAPARSIANARVDVVLRSETDPSAVPVELRSIAISDKAELALPEGVWALDAASDAYWHARQYILPADTAIVVHLQEKAFLTGRLTADAQLPKEMTLALTTESSEDRRTEYSTDCPIVEASFRCEVPSGTYDLSLTAAGFIPQSWLGMTLPPHEETRLPDVALRQGQSILARVTVPKGSDLARAVVHVEHRGGVRLRSVHPDARGTAQITGVAPGAYVVTATHPDGLVSERVDVIVRERAEARVPEILTLSRPRTLAVRISPPLSPTFKSWVIGMARATGDARQRELVTSGSASDTGEWRSAPVRPDTYDVTVSSDNGDVWYRETVLVHTQDEERQIAIEMRRIHGTVRLGENPVSALLMFTSPSLRAVSTASDDKGKFDVVLPDSTATEWKVWVSVPDLRIKRETKVTLSPQGTDEVAIDLPVRTLAGTVVDADGAPVSGAIVDIVGDGELQFTQTIAEDDGSFVVAAVPNGMYSLKARAGARESGVVEVRIPEADGASVTLTVQQSKELKARIVSPTGPVEGARVQVVPRGGWVPTFYTYTTREDGQFGAMLPPETTEIDLLIAAPGFAFTTANVPYRKEVLTVVVQQSSGSLELVGGASDPAARLLHDGATIHLGGALSYEWPSRRDAGGIFTAPQMEPGLYRYCANGSCVEGFLAPNATLRLAIQ